MNALAVAYIVLLVATGMTIAGTALALYFLQQRSRATVFSDFGFRATVLLAAVFYLSVFAQNQGAFNLDPDVLRLFSGIGFFLVAAFVGAVSFFLWRVSRAIDGPVLVSAELLVGMRSRMEAMFGPESTRFLVYAVGKESAQKAVAQLVERRVMKPEQLWKGLPAWFRTAGYGRLVVERMDPGHEVRVRVEGTFESQHPGAEPACDLTRGYLAGLGQALEPTMDCEAQELRCGLRHGGHDCEFALLWFPRDAPHSPKPVAVKEA